MNYTRLLELDPSLRDRGGAPCSSVTLGRPGFPSGEDALFFADNRTFFEKVKKGVSDKKVILIVSEAFYESDEARARSFAKRLLSTGNMPLTLSRLSKGFYDERFSQRNPTVDGRETGKVCLGEGVQVAPNVFLGEGVSLGKGVILHHGVTLMSGVSVGEGSQIFPNVTIYPDVSLGKRVRIHGGTTIGSDGFGYKFFEGVHHKIWHTGSVLIEDDVEIGANACIDGGTFSPTIVRSGSKIDNLVLVSHNCEVGPGVILCGQTGLGGSSRVGDFSILGGRVGFVDGVSLGPFSRVAGGAVLTKNWKEGSVLGGWPARPLRQWLRGMASARKGGEE